MIKFLFGSCLLALVIASSHAEIVTRDLGYGLNYFRITSLSDDLPSVSTPGSCVLDLRFASGDAKSAKSFHIWLERRGEKSDPVFVLINNRTGIELLEILSARHLLPGVLSIGQATDRFQPDIVIQIDPKLEQRAYDALIDLNDVTELITTKPTKVRRDEAALIENKNSNESILKNPAIELTDDIKIETAPAPLIDIALQRAVQIHQAWIVLHE